MIFFYSSKILYPTLKGVFIMKKITAGKEKHEIFINQDETKGMIILPNRTVKHGTIKVKKDRYKYFQYRSGTKVLQIYLGKL